MGRRRGEERGHEHGALLPFGEHKGHGLAVAYEILDEALSGGTTLPDTPDPAAIINQMLSFVVYGCHDVGADPGVARGDASIVGNPQTPGLRQFIARAFEEVFGNHEKLKQGRNYTVALARRET